MLTALYKPGCERSKKKGSPMGIFDDIAGAAKLYACSLYDVLPDAMVGTPYARTRDWLLNDFCAPPNSPGLPPPATSQFQGGQCNCAKYRVEYRMYETYQGQEYNRLGGVSLNGEITASKIVNNSSESSVYFLCRGPASSPCSPSLIWTPAYNSPAVPGFLISRIAVENVYRTDGGADNCGNPPISHPTVAPFPPEGRTSPPSHFIFNGGLEVNLNFNIKPPPPPPLPGEPDFVPPLVVTVGSPDFYMDMPVQFNYDGSYSFGGEGGGLPPELADRLDKLGNDLGDLDKKFSDLDKLVNFQFDPPIYFDSPEVKKEEKQIDDSGEEDEDKEGLLGVLVELTKLPTDIQFGTPNVNFAGWLTFLVQGGYTPRSPIAFERGFFPAPEGATGYALTFTKGARGKVTIFSKDK